MSTDKEKIKAAITTEIEEETDTVGRLEQLREYLFNSAMSGNMTAADMYIKIERFLLEVLNDGMMRKVSGTPTNGLIKVRGG